MMSIAVGVDPGLRCTGVVAIYDGGILVSQRIETVASDTDTVRIRRVGTEFSGILGWLDGEWPGEEIVVGVESQFYAMPIAYGRGRGEQTAKVLDAIRVSRVAERVCAICDMRGLTWFDVSPADVKRAWGCSPRSDKEPLVRMAMHRYPEWDLPRYVRGPRQGQVRVDDASHLVDAGGAAMHAASVHALNEMTCST